MTYSVWADGQRIGETRLELRPSPRRRTGAFHPTVAGLTVLPALTRPGARSALEVRDSEGRCLRWEAIAITDVDRLIAAARSRRAGAIHEAADACGPLKFVISLTVDPCDGERATDLPGSEHLAAKGGQATAD